MFRAKLIKTFALGLCMSALFTGAAFAQSGAGSSPSFGGEIEVQDKALFDKQLEIDRYLFADHVKEIEEKGIRVNYTGVADTYVEIGISPYTDENANYLYEIFGKDIVKVVEAEQAVLYTTDIAPDAATSGMADEIYTTMEISPETPVASTDAEDAVLEDRVYKDGGDVQIQIESVDDGAELENSDVIFQTTAAEADSKEVQLVSAPVENAEVVMDKEESKGLSAPITILLIAGGAALIGGTVIVLSKKRA